MIRIIHNLGGCGGTLLSRCLGVLPGVALLSEINPLSVKLFPQFDPLWQDAHWLHLLTGEDIERFSRMDLGHSESFRELVGVFHERAEAAGRALVLRDYNYVDFIAVPYFTTAPRRRIIYDALPQGIPTAAVALLRHPVDQWLSLCKHEHVRSILKPSYFSDAYESFLRELRDTSVVKYEDLVTAPETTLRELTSALQLPFNRSCVVNFHQYDYVTGDFSRHQETAISLPARRPLDASAASEFAASASFQRILQLTGYADGLASATHRPVLIPRTEAPQGL